MELLTNGPNENRILLHSLLKEIQEWIAAMCHSGGAMDVKHSTGGFIFNSAGKTLVWRRSIPLLMNISPARYASAG
jgi:hypothetical protein